MSTRAPDTLQPADTWRENAACRPGNGHDPDLWHPDGTTGAHLLQIAEAKTICRRCPVIDQCLMWAIETGQDEGVWGGLDKDERRLHKRREGLHGGSRHRAPCGSAAAYRRHLRNGTPIDPACREANRLAQQEKADQQKAIGRPPAPCGTDSAYNRHTRKGEPIDDACRRAHREADQRRRSAGKAAA